MKTRLPNKLRAWFLFFGLGLINFLENIKVSRAEWRMPESTGGLPIDVGVCFAYTAIRFIISPLIFVGIIFYAVAFYFKKNIDKSRKIAIWGKRSLKLAFIVFALLLIYLVLESRGFWYDHGLYESKWYGDWCDR